LGSCLIDRSAVPPRERIGPAWNYPEKGKKSDTACCAGTQVPAELSGEEMLVSAGDSEMGLMGCTAGVPQKAWCGTLFSVQLSCMCMDAV
jgi:hypothetical protein